ncbi:hypothetical protein DIZ76_013134 [Coccidioides immitis]|nr:hypothetical protein DIZ76_013134 [Coccidioides immitis]
MSDIEDEMDIDVQPAKHSISSSLEDVKGKRIQADLPVEAEDNLPWVEKYRPSTLDDVSGHQDIIATINRFIESNVSSRTSKPSEIWHPDSQLKEWQLATTSSFTLRPTRNRQDLHDISPRPADIRR